MHSKYVVELPSALVSVGKQRVISTSGGPSGADESWRPKSILFLYLTKTSKLFLVKT